MQMIPEAPLLTDRKTLAITGAGSSCCSDITRVTDFLSRTGGFGQLLATLALAKNPTEVWKVREAVENHCQDYRKNFEDGSGPEFVHLEQRLGGPGKEFLKRVDLPIRQLPFYGRDVKSAAEWFLQALMGSGGVEILLQLLSSGGHIVPQKLLEHLVAASLNRPPLVASSLIRPHRVDAAANLIFVEQIRLLLKHRLAGADVLVLRDNNQATQSRPLGEQDRIAVAAMLAPFSARKSKTFLPAVEAYDALARKGGLVGIWGDKVEFKVLQVGPFWRKQRVKDQFIVVEQTLQAMYSLMEESRTSLTGIPADTGGQSIFAVIGNLTRTGFEVVEGEMERHGPVLFVPAPFLRIYVTRLANIDRYELADELGLAVGLPGPSPAMQNAYGLEWAFEEIAERFNSAADSIFNPWDRRAR